jgi:hypothetical protein
MRRKVAMEMNIRMSTVHSDSPKNKVANGDLTFKA